jgi:predicted nucleic acid-binding protein
LRGVGRSARPRLPAAALTLYFDTSALVKLLVEEDGSELAAELWGSAHLAASSILSCVEGRAALAAALGGRRLTPQGHARALAEFEEIQRGLVLIGVDGSLARQAGELAERFELRGYDAVHLATALDLGDEDVAVITWDDDLSRAAGQNGLAVAGAQPR